MIREVLVTDPIAGATDLDYDPTSPEVLADPLPAYETLRAQCPVHLFEGLEHPLYTLSRLEDVHAQLSDPELWSNRFGPGISYSEQNPGSLQRYDPPEHTLRRRFLREPFLPKAVEAFQPAVSELAASLIDGFESRGQAELHDDYASPLPITAFTRLLGLPLDDRPQFKYWAEKLTLGMTYPDQATDDWLALRTYTLAKVRARRDAMAAADLGLEDDPVGTVVPEGLLSHLACHRLGDGNFATDDEVTGLVAMMLVAGHETTTSLVTNTVWRLLEDRTRWERLLAEPDLVPNVIEESLRFDPPVLGDCRTNTAPVTIHGVDIPANSKVMHLLRSANHDPDLCEAPDEFRMDRPLLENRKHYAFGWGTHFCLGAHLARMTARTALGQLIVRLPDLRLDGPTERLQAPFLWGRRVLPVAWS